MFFDMSASMQCVFSCFVDEGMKERDTRGTKVKNDGDIYMM